MINRQVECDPNAILVFELIFIAIVIGIVGIIANAAMKADEAKSRANAIVEEIRNLPDFHADHILVMINDQRGLAIDEARGLVMLIGPQSRRTVSFDRIISSEIKEDSASIVKTERSATSLAAGFLIGGELGAATVLAAPQHSKSVAGVRSVRLFIVTDDLQIPNHAVTFLTCATTDPISKSSQAYRNAIANAELWHSRLTVAMRRAEQTKIAASQPNSSGQISAPRGYSAAAPTGATAPTIAIGSPPDVKIGGRYRIVRQIGGGGMKKVYLAEDSRLGNRQCALAEMIDNFSTADERQRAITVFERECNLLAALNDPRIPKIFDCFSEQERHYLVMEFVDGVTLEALLASNGGKIDEGAVVAVAVEVLATLDYLHGLNPPVIYRDLKPSNIMVTPTGEIKLIDFGIARHFQPSKTMTMMGTQGYAAPEQYSGRAEIRSDLYGTGAVMHHALTGRDPALQPPFSFPPIAELLPSTAPGLAECIDQALSYKPDDRPASAAEMRERLLQLPHSIPPDLIPTAQPHLNDTPVSQDSDVQSDQHDSARESGPIGHSYTCQNCGAELPDDDSGCASCEAVKDAPAVAPASKEAAYSNKIAIGIIALIFGPIAIAAILSRGTNPVTPGVNPGAPDAPSQPTATELPESEKAAQEAVLLNTVRHLPSSDYADNLQIYQQLLALRPENKNYRAKVKRYGRLQDRAGTGLSGEDRRATEQN